MLPRAGRIVGRTAAKARAVQGLPYQHVSCHAASRRFTAGRAADRCDLQRWDASMGELGQLSSVRVSFARNTGCASDEASRSLACKHPKLMPNPGAAERFFWPAEPQVHEHRRYQPDYASCHSRTRTPPCWLCCPSHVPCRSAPKALFMTSTVVFF